MFENLKISTRILLVLSSIAIISVGISGFTSYISARKSLEEESFNKLTAVREMKAVQIEDYFQNITDQIRTFSENQMIVDAMKEFNNGFDQIAIELGTDKKMVCDILNNYYENEFLERLRPNVDSTQTEFSVDTYMPEDVNTCTLQNLYIAENPYDTGNKHKLDDTESRCTYSEVHRKYHPIIRSYLEKFGYYDIFLIDHETGHVVYTVFKEVDLGTSLEHDIYSNTNFGEAFRAAKWANEKDFVKLVDFNPYQPSYNSHASFIASPIYDGNEKVGVLVFQMPVDKINDIMTNKQHWADVGLGNSGETYIVASDHKIRNQSRFLIEDRENYFRMIERIGVKQKTIDRIRNFNSTIGLQEVKTIGTESAHSGETGTKIFNDYRGISVLSSYKPLKIKNVN